MKPKYIKPITNVGHATAGKLYPITQILTHSVAFINDRGQELFVANDQVKKNFKLLYK